MKTLGEQLIEIARAAQAGETPKGALIDDDDGGFLLPPGFQNALLERLVNGPPPPRTWWQRLVERLRAIRVRWPLYDSRYDY